MRTTHAEPYMCIIACKMLNFTNINIFDISAEKSTTRSISYSNKMNKADYVIKIGDSLNNVVFSNGFESYLLTGQNQSNISHMKEKYVR